MDHGKVYYLKPYEYLLDNGHARYSKKVKKSKDCSPRFPPFFSGDKDLDIWIFGDAFLSKFIVMFNKDDDTVGIGIPHYKKIREVQKKEKRGVSKFKLPIKKQKRVLKR
jgi:Eukaryotic aspartyl protease